MSFTAAQGAAADEAGERFERHVRPFITAHCAECHRPGQAEAELDLTRFKTTAALADEYRQWEHVITFVSRQEMPPSTAKSQPTPAAREEFIRQVRAILALESRKLAGDPGLVLSRRLTSAEYDHAIRELTTVDLRPTATFPLDPAAGEGFSNTGEALAMSPSLFNKWYGAAQQVADHALLTTQGLTFAPYPVVAFADRVKYFEQAILQFYQDHRVDYRRSLTAAWQYQRLPADQRPPIEDWAREQRLSPVYLRSLHRLLTASPSDDRFYLAWLRQRWSQIMDAPESQTPRLLDALVRDLEALSRQLTPRETEAIVSNAGNAPIQHLERRRKTAAERDQFDQQSLRSSRRFSRSVTNLDRSESLRITLAIEKLSAQGTPAAAPDTNSAADNSALDMVILKSLNFSSAAPDQYKTDDATRNVSLRDLLAKYAPGALTTWRFGMDSSGAALPGDTLVLRAGQSLQCELPREAWGMARELRFYVDAELDGRDKTSTALLVHLRIDTPAERPAAAPTSLFTQQLPPEVPLVRGEVPAVAELAKSASELCRLFPNRFYYVDDTRGLSAGFHLIEGFFRDDQPLMKSVLDEAQRKQLDGLWSELEFVTGITERMLRGFVFFERSERNFLKHADFDPFKEEDPRLVTNEVLEKFEQVYLERSGVKQPMSELAQHPIHLFFEQIRQGLKRQEQQLRTAQARYRQQLLDFAHRAYRRPLTTREQSELGDFFDKLATQPDQGVEVAVRATLVRILVSPHFGCHIVPAADGNGVQPLRDLDLASRLSFFLWSSIPDQELLAVAESGKLRDEVQLRQQIRRLVADERVADFAREFFGQWLGYRDFPQREAIDRAVFKDFDDSLRDALYEEPTQLAAHLIRTDQSILRLLDSNETFVNRRLAKHYGIAYPEQPGAGGGQSIKGAATAATATATAANPADDWRLVLGLNDQGRAGILGMGVFLAKNSQPQRTSPVKRGFWVVHHVLGEHIPAPPADVVALPAKETDTNGKTIRELLKLHVEDEKCARCHQRFDDMGLAMEGFDPIGRRRTQDLAGRPIDQTVRTAAGQELRGVPDFSRYLLEQRKDDFKINFCRKLLGFALGRSLQLSDQSLLDEMKLTLDKQGDRFVPLLELVVLSPQFLNQRAKNFTADDWRRRNSAATETTNQSDTGAK
ncbi:MAG: DUF1592 domain-containing protein [Planctomycetota bacterium]